MTEGVIHVLARLHDLVVMGQPNPDAGVNGLRPGDVALAAGRPALIIPYAGDFAELGWPVSLSPGAAPARRRGRCTTRCS